MLCILYTSMAFACGILGDEYASHAGDSDTESSTFSSLSRWSPSHFLQASSAKAKYLLFLSNSPLPNEPSTILNSTKVNATTNSSGIVMGSEILAEGWDVIFGVLGMAISISRNLCTFHSNLFLLLITLSLGSHSKGLYNLLIRTEGDVESFTVSPGQLKVKTYGPPRDEVVLSKYRGLKELSILLNGTFGHLILLYVLTSIATIATYIDSVIVEPDLFTKIRIAWSTNTFLIILTVGSNICNQVREWLCTYLWRIS